MRGIKLALSVLGIIGGISVSRAQTPGDSVLQRIILIGDAGELKNGHHPVVDALKRKVDFSNPHNTVIYLGDNVYPLGLPDESSPGYPAARAILDYQVSLVKGTKSQAIFIPGNHDWKRSKPDGWNTVKNQQQYIDSLNLPNVSFFPKDGCPGPVPVPIGDNIIVLLFDSEWWLFPYDKPDEKSDCECKTKNEVLAVVNDIAKRNPRKIIVFASHHPFRSYGPHGGNYTIKQHIFPLTDLNPSLYIPLPIIGSIYPLTRGVFGTLEDLPNTTYQEMVTGVETALADHGPVIFVSGHDHTLQYIEDKKNFYIVSGAGAKQNRVRKGPGSEFASNENGFAMLEYLKDSTMRVRYFTVDDMQQPVFAKELFKYSGQGGREALPAPAPVLKPVITMPIDEHYNKAGKAYRFWFGENYRTTWAAPVDFPVIRLDSMGLKPLKRGGGMQTYSLRLEDKNGDEWVLRSLKKYPERAIPEALRQTFAKDIVQDNMSSAMPYGPAAVARLAEAAGVPHANPRFVYLPDDTALGVYRELANDVYLFEEREPGNHGKTLNTGDMLNKIWKDNDDQVNQKALLRARILDMYIADWDRHDDQWRWYVKKKSDGRKEYYPVPRDRDQGFYVNEGVVPRLVSRPYLLPRIQGFRSYFKDINGFNTSEAHIDRAQLNEMDEKDWSKATKQFIAVMTDSVLHHAVAAMPDTVQKLEGQGIYDKLVSRRGKLEAATNKYYRFISKGVDVVGSHKNELFLVKRLPQGKLSVDAYKISKKDEVQQNLYSRVFDPAVTKEVRVYGLGGEDRFIITGDDKTPIRLRLIGGKDTDTYIDSTNGRAGKKVLIYDLANRKDSFALDGADKKKLSNRPEVIRYDRLAFKYNRYTPLLAAGYNYDDGVSLGLGYQFITQGFRKAPFAAKQTFSVTHSLLTKAWNFHYNGLFTDVIGRTDLELDGRIRAPKNVQNFFGYGNETVFDKDDHKIYYYRSRYSLYSVNALLRNDLGPHVHVGYGPLVEHYGFDPDDNQDRFVTDFGHNGLDSARVVQSKSYIGVGTLFQVDTRDRELLPTKGINWVTTLQGRHGWDHSTLNTATLKSDITLFASARVPNRLTFVTRFGGGVIWGDYEYFQALTLSGNNNMRGYRNDRFAGRGLVYNNTEFRLKLFDFRNYILPGTVGLIAFNDVGRVWVKDEVSHVWHDGYGGGIYFSPIDMFVLTASLAHSYDGNMFYASFGFKF